MPAPRHDRNPNATGSMGALSGDPLDHLLTLEDATTDQALAAVADLVERSRPAWHNDAACRGPEADGIDFTSRSGPMQSRAVQICGGCSVRSACLDWAFEIGDETAVLGGMTPSARRAHQRAADARNRKRARP